MSIKHTHIETETMRSWLEHGTVRVMERGEENLYARDEFGNRFFAKHDDKLWVVHCNECAKVLGTVDDEETQVLMHVCKDCAD